MSIRLEQAQLWSEGSDRRRPHTMIEMMVEPTNSPFPSASAAHVNLGDSVAFPICPRVWLQPLYTRGPWPMTFRLGRRIHRRVLSIQPFANRRRVPLGLLHYRRENASLCLCVLPVSAPKPQGTRGKQSSSILEKPCRQTIFRTNPGGCPSPGS